jgi:hypothetical protein
MKKIFTLVFLGPEIDCEQNWVKITSNFDKLVAVALALFSSTRFKNSKVLPCL